jgi:Tol biopolymer transport system component
MRVSAYHEPVSSRIYACVSVLASLVALTACKSEKQDRVAFVSMRSDPPGVHVSYADGTQPVRVSSSRVWVAAAPIWAADGTRLAYTVEAGPDKWAIEIYDVRTGASAQVVKDMKLEDWSPDGAWLIATTLVDTDQLLGGKKPLKKSLQQLYAVAVDGSSKVKLSDGAGWDYSPAVSPDGSRVAFMSNRSDKVELRLVNTTGGGGKRLVQVRGDDVLGAPAWSPDGSTLAFECKRGGAAAIQRLCRVSSEGGEAPDLTSIWAASPAWSPDGTKLAFVAKDALGNEQLHVMNRDGSGITAITSEGRNTHPTWSPDGTRLAFVSDVEGNPEVMHIRATGGSPSNVSSHVSRDAFPAWQPRVAAPPAP